jgi:signal transduction histidine kinase/ActR/RegA family two-component response regulator
MKGINLDFSEQYLQATLIVSLLSVWVLVGLFYYLNRYTKRDYFTVWTAAWLFYALWLTLSLTVQKLASAEILFMLKQWCVCISAVFLLWGSLRFLNLPVRQSLFGLFMAFLMVWTLVSPQVFSSDSLQCQLPVFILIGLGSVFAGVCFYRLRKKMPYVGSGMLSLGFLLWGCYLVSYPFTQQKGYEGLYSAGFLVAAVLQLFIAVSMIVLVLEEVRYKAEQTLAEIARVQLEKEQLQLKVITTEEECRNLYDRVRLTEGTQKAYDELRRTQQNVVQQERLRALGQMASGVAHDVNNALSPIVAYSDLVLHLAPDLPETARNCLTTIKRAGNDIANIVARMREFYRRRSDTEHLSKVNLNQIIDEVIELTRPRWRDVSQREGISINIQKETAADIPAILSEPTDLREALTNLVFNAVDALPQGGTITLATRVRQVSGEPPDTAEKTQLEVEVRDDGMGMDEKTRRRCLEPFFSTKAQRGGTGLGLAMVYGMMQRHDGTIDIESSPGQGTCVRLTFPVREFNLPAASTVILQNPELRPLDILCIDDEPEVRQMLKDCLGFFQHHIEVAESGPQGLEMFRAAKQNNRPFKAVITDLGMSEMDGRQVARAIKAESPSTPVIMLTGWGAMMKENGERADGIDALVGKPPGMEELNRLLLRLNSLRSQN